MLFKGNPDVIETANPPCHVPQSGGIEYGWLPKTESDCHSKATRVAPGTPRATPIQDSRDLLTQPIREIRIIPQFNRQIAIAFCQWVTGVAVECTVQKLRCDEWDVG